VPRLDALRQLAEERLADGGPAIGLEQVALAMAAAALDHAGTRRPPEPPAPGRAARDRAFDALALLEQWSTDEVRLTDLAAAVGLSPFHFLRLFKREVGVTPYRFLLQARIRHAIRLLRETQRPATEIALDIGFSDLSNFIRTFRREVGCSPSQLRSGASNIYQAAQRPPAPRCRHGSLSNRDKEHGCTDSIKPRRAGGSPR
jgi:AraC-like DNA-binding protein